MNPHANFRLPWRGTLGGVRWSALAAAGLGLVARSVGAAPPPLAETLSPRPGEQRLCRLLSPGAPGTSLTVAVDPALGRPLRLAVEQRGLDVEIVVPPTATEPGRVLDSPQDRQGEESLWLDRGSEIGAVEVRARERGAPAGEVCVRWLADEAPSGWPALDRAAALYGHGDRASRALSLAAYEESLTAFRAGPVPAGAARALFALAVVSRLVDEPARALAWGREALPRLLELDERALAAALANDLGLDHLLLGETDAARREFERARDLARAVGDRFDEAVAANNLCRLDAAAGDLLGARACYRAARPALATAGAPALEAAAWISSGRIEDVLGEPDAARAAYQRALDLQEQVGDDVGRARTQNNLGLLEQQLGRFEAAIAAYAQALDRFIAIGDRRWQARVRNNLGLAYQQVGRRELAIVQWQDALPLWRAVGDGAGEASTEINLALADLGVGRPAAAMARIERALSLAEGAGDRRGVAGALAARARAEAAAGEVAKARASYAEALPRLETLGDRAGEAEAQLGLGELELLSNPESRASARAPFTRALELARALGQGRREARALEALGRLDRVEGDAEGALAFFDAALRVLDGERAHLFGGEAEAGYSDLVHGLLAEAVDLALAADRAHPERGGAARALALVERLRGRALVALLAEAGVDLAVEATATTQSAPVADLVARRAALSLRLAAKADRAAGASDPAVRAALARDAAEIETELDLVEAEIRTLSPAGRALLPPPALDPTALAATLPADTLVLVYHLAAERSALFALVRGRIARFDLGARAELEDAALAFFRASSRRDPADRAAEQSAAAALAEHLLGPVAADLVRPRLLIATDGALAYVPWAALPAPASGRPLVAEHEISFVPSLSALAALRERASARRGTATKAATRGAETGPEAGPIAACFADPVFAADDPRLARAPVGTPAVASERGAPFARLPASADEVARIVALAPRGAPLLVRTGFAASRATLLEDDLAHVSILHFATHGVIDARTPSLSGLALSRFAADGSEVEGFLHLRDIYRLRLGADLVVLSGCETALGADLRGEGLVGLARAFLDAGASAVVASLWPVDDRAAGPFMERFYLALWRDGLAPAAALARAQRETARERRTRDPATWAGWVLLGDGSVPLLAPRATE